MSVESMAIVLHHSPAKGTDKVILLGIANHDGDGGAWPTIKTLAKYANIDARGVKKALGRLEESGQITRHIQQGGTLATPHAERPNMYVINVVCPPDCDRTTAHRIVKQGGVSPRTPGVPQDTRGGVPQDTRGGVPQDTQTILEPPGEPSKTDGASSEGPLRPVTRATRDEPNSESPSPNRDASGARWPWRPFPNQCSGHQEVVHDGRCYGCKRTRETNLVNDNRRAERVAEALEVIDLMPPCPHGRPGGHIPHPEHPDTLVCPLCRTGTPADDTPTRMTREESQRLHTLLNAPDTTTTPGVTPSILEATEGTPR